MTLEVGTWGDQVTAANYASVMAYFKLGSVIGFDLTGNFTSGQMTAIRFNPTNTTWTSYGTNETSGTGIIPGFDTSDYDTGLRDVSASTWHNSTNVPLGKGDPCRLVGLTVAQIKAGSIDSGLYRLPTRDENGAFVGATGTQVAGSAYYTWTANGVSAADPGVGTFPVGGISLPAAGFRDSSGSVSNQGTRGCYWSSTVVNGAYGYYLLFDSSTVSPSGAAYYAYGNAVRCVRQ
jgi:hypothetical protein